MDITILFTCPICGREHELIVDFEQYLEYQSGALVQDAFPHMSPTDRERFVSGLCPDCQEEVFREF